MSCKFRPLRIRGTIGSVCAGIIVISRQRPWVQNSIECVRTKIGQIYKAQLNSSWNYISRL